MKDFPAWLGALGVNIKDILAAFLGAVAAALFMPSATPRQIITVVFVGTIAGNYFGEYIADKLPFGRGGACVLVGFCAMILAERAMTAARKINIPGLGGTDGTG